MQCTDMHNTLKTSMDSGHLVALMEKGGGEGIINGSPGVTIVLAVGTVCRVCNKLIWVAHEFAIAYSTIDSFIHSANILEPKWHLSRGHCQSACKWMDSDGSLLGN